MSNVLPHITLCDVTISDTYHMALSHIVFVIGWVGDSRLFNFVRNGPLQAIRDIDSTTGYPWLSLPWQQVIVLLRHVAGSSLVS